MPYRVRSSGEDAKEDHNAKSDEELGLSPMCKVNSDELQLLYEELTSEALQTKQNFIHWMRDAALIPEKEMDLDGDGTVQ